MKSICRQALYLAASAIIAFFNVCTAPNIALAEPNQEILPKQEELLKEPIKLCTDMVIIEWRGEINKDFVKQLNKTCKKVLISLPYFFKIKKISYPKINICIIPIDSNKRNLNDLIYRFKDREKTYSIPGIVDSIWGYTDYSSNTVFIKNDVDNSTLRVFAHELYHAITRYMLTDLNNEQNANKFTKYIGL